MKRTTKKACEIEIGDILLLDVYHMDEQEHKVLEIIKTKCLFTDENLLSFKVKCEGDIFETIGFDINSKLDMLDKQF
jgi:hypothetical protein